MGRRGRKVVIRASSGQKKVGKPLPDDFEDFLDGDVDLPFHRFFADGENLGHLPVAESLLPDHQEDQLAALRQGLDRFGVQPHHFPFHQSGFRIRLCGGHLDGHFIDGDVPVTGIGAQDPEGFVPRDHVDIGFEVSDTGQQMPVLPDDPEHFGHRFLPVFAVSDEIAGEPVHSEVEQVVQSGEGFAVSFGDGFQYAFQVRALWGHRQFSGGG